MVPNPSSAVPERSHAREANPSDDATHVVDREALLERWVHSPENARTRSLFLFLGLGGILLLYGGLGLGVWAFTEVDRTGEDPNGGLVALGVALAVGGLSAMAFALHKRTSARAAFYERQERAAKEGVDEALEQLGGETDLRGLLRVNRRQMEAYETLTRRQAASSYRLSHVALAVGLALIVGGAVVAVVADGGVTKAAAAGLAALAGALSGFIARTYLRIYERTLAQLNYYFDQPLVASYVLTAERLVDKMSTQRRDDALSRIVDHVLLTMGDGPARSDLKPPAPTKEREDV